MKTSEKSIIYNGRSYTPDGKGYFYNCTTRKRLHQAIWEDHYGEIPEGYQIHHIDHDKSNNDISNLTCISAEDHRDVHSKELTEEMRESLRKNMNEKARPEAIKWHKSEAGREWHKEHMLKLREKGLFTKEKTCLYCGKTFTAEAHGKYCSNKCKSADRRKSGVDNVEFVCAYCGKVFYRNKYSKALCCSRSCANHLRGKNAVSKD